MSLADVLAAPAWVPVVALAPVVWVASRSLDRRRAARLAALVGPRVEALAFERRERSRATRRALFAGGLLLALVAALRPSWGEAAPSEARGADIVLCLDVSRSMLARDGAGSTPSATNAAPVDRLTRAKREIRALGERVRGERLGLVVFAGEARVRAPLTRDGAAVADLADASDPYVVARGGTDLGAAIDAALGVLGAPGSGDAAGAAIVVLTDGEDLAGRGFAAARACRERGVVVHGVGFGEALGSKIALPDESSPDGPSAAPTSEQFLRDRAGREVVSAMDAAGLSAITDATGGRFVAVDLPGHPLVALYEERIAGAASRSKSRAADGGRENQFQWPLLAAIALWLLDLSITDRRRR